MSTVFVRCRIPVENALRDAKLDLKDLNEVILVGGSTRIPAVQVRTDDSPNRDHFRVWILVLNNREAPRA